MTCLVVATTVHRVSTSTMRSTGVVGAVTVAVLAVLPASSMSLSIHPEMLKSVKSLTVGARDSPA